MSFDNASGHDLRMTDSDELQRKYWAGRIREMPPELVIRECIHHIFEASAAGVVTNPQFRIAPVKVDGIQRLCLINSARGMTENEILSFATELHWSSVTDKPNGAEANKGFGIRADALRASPGGVIYISARDGMIWQVRMWLDADGAPRASLPDRLSSLPFGLKGHLGIIARKGGALQGIDPDNFFAVILMGEPGRENTVQKPYQRAGNSAYYGIGAERYWTFGGVTGLVTSGLERGSNGPWIVALGDWLDGREAQLKANPAAANVLKNPVIRFDDGDVEVVIFHAFKMYDGKPSSSYMVGAGEYTNGCGIIADGSAVPEVYSQTTGKLFKRLSGAFELNLVADEVSVYVRLKGNGYHVHSERRHVLWEKGYDAKNLDGNLVEMAREGAKVSIRDFSYSILRAIKSEQAGWLRKLIEEKRKTKARQENIEARLAMHRMAAQLDLLDRDGLTITKEGEIAVDPDQTKPQPKPGPGPKPNPNPGPTPNPGPEPKPQPKPGPTPSPDGQKRAKNFGATFREFTVDEDKDMERDVPFFWDGWETEGTAATLFYNHNFPLFEQMRELLVKTFGGAVGVETVESHFHNAMSNVLSQLLSSWYVMTRYREARGDLKSKSRDEREAVWVGAANTCLYCFFDLQEMVIASVTKSVETTAKIAAE